MATVNKGSTNSASVTLFIAKLAAHFDKEWPEWRKSCVLVLDNATYHRSKEVTEFLDRLKVDVMYLGPYQFRMAPVEHVFGFLKSKYLNPGCTRASSR